MGSDDRLGSSNVDGRRDTEDTPEESYARHPRSLNCKQILRDPARWWWIFVVAFVAFMPFALALDREPPYTRMRGTITPENPHPGDMIEITWEIRQNRNCYPAMDNNLSRYIIDADRVILEFAKVPTLFGTEKFSVDPTSRMATIVRPLKLPRTTAPGPAVYRSSARFVCDLFNLQKFHHIVIDGPEIPFNVGSRLPTERS